MPREDLTTRYLCAAAYLDPDLADTGRRTLVDDTHRAVHPCLGLDLTAVARHAAAARSAVRGRRIVMGVARIAVPFLLLAIYISASAPQETAYGYTDGGPSGEGLLLVIIAWLAVIAVLSFLFHWQALAKALAVMTTNTYVGDLAPTLPDEVEARLANLDSANTVVFSGAFGTGNPFTGSGTPVAAWTITMDVSSARPSGTQNGTGGQHTFGGPAGQGFGDPGHGSAASSGNSGGGGGGGGGEIEPFDAADLHEWLASSVPSVSFPDLTARERLYVSGFEAPLVPGLVGDRERPPLPTVSAELLRSVLHEPTNYARTYLGFEKSTWGGQLGITYLVRAQMLQGKTLFVEGVALAMFPVSSDYLIGATVSRESGERFVAGLRLVGRTLRQDLFGTSLRKLLTRMITRRDLSEVERQAARNSGYGVVVDYGAITSIRQFVAAGKKDSHFANADELMYLNILQRRILEKAVEFLRLRGVDTSEFERQATVVRNNYFGSVHNIGRVSGSGHSFGDGNQINNRPEGTPDPAGVPAG